MKIIKNIFILLFLTFAVLTGASVPAQAAQTYDTYTYDNFGKAKITPDAYLPRQIDSAADLLQYDFIDPSDVFVAADGGVYIADTGNNRIVAFNKDYSFRIVIEKFKNTETGREDSLNKPEGLFVCAAGDRTENGAIYVADTENSRLVVFDLQGRFVREMPKPQDTVLATVPNYQPVAVAVDTANRIYVVSRNATVGVIALNQNNGVDSFLGAQPVMPNFWDRFWRIFQSEAQKKAGKKFIPNQYNNLTVDEKNFIFVTTDNLDVYAQYAATIGRSGASNFAPVKRLNPSGTDILKRNGFFPPSGDVDVAHSGSVNFRVARIADVAVTDNGQYSLLDREFKRIFTYNAEGELLYAFGKKDGSQVGTFSNPCSIAYKGTDILVLDKTDGTLNVFYRTKYGNAIAEALQLQEKREYTAAREAWSGLLHQNANLDLAHIGIGKTYYRQGEFKLAMESFKNANYGTEYSKAFTEYRKELIGRYFPVFTLGAAALAACLWLLSRVLKKVNKKQHVPGQKTTVPQDLALALRIMLRPVKGYGELVLEKRGSVKSASIILLATVLAFLFKGNASGYLFTSDSGPAIQVFGILTAFGFWCACNWALTALMSGEGTLKRIYIVSAYALLPLPLLLIPQTFLSHLFSWSEYGMYNFIGTLAILWMGLLMFFASLIIHDYSLTKNILAVVGTILFMICLVFLCLLFIDLMQRIVNFFSGLYDEVHFRL